MDNMPRVPAGYNPIYSHGHMVWLDTNLQQLFTANLLLEMGFYLERWQEIEDLESEAEMLKRQAFCMTSMPMDRFAQRGG